MQPRLNDIVAKLGVAEKDIIEKQFLGKLTIWARLIDEVEAGLPYIDELPNRRQQFNEVKTRFEGILGQIDTLDIAQDPSRVTTIQQEYTGFGNRDYEHLLNLKQLLRAATEDQNDIEALKKVVSDAKKQRAEFEKSFNENLQKQSVGSQRTLAKHFDARLAELRKNDETNPSKWLGKRNDWMKKIIYTILGFVALYVILILTGAIKGYEIHVALVKTAIIALLYTQYYFATRNYHIYSDLAEKYEHLAVISKTMTDFIAAAYDDPQLKEAVLINASKTLFAELSTGHTKNPQTEASVFENVINQIPRTN